MAEKKNDVEVGVGVKLDPRLEKKLEKVDKRLALSHKKQERAAARQKKQLGNLAQGQKAQTHATLQSARALDVMSRNLNEAIHDLRRYNREVDRSKRKNRSFLHSLGRVSRGGLRTAGGLAGVAGVTAGMYAGANYAAYAQREFTRIGVAADASEAQVAALKAQIYATAKRKDIAVDPAQITAAVAQVLEKTGDFDLAQSSVETIAKAISATGAEGFHVGSMIADFKQKMGIKDPRGILETLDTIVLQGKTGSFTLANLAGQGDRALSAYAGAGRTGFGAVRELGGLLQLAKRGTGSPEQAVTAIEALIRDFQANYDAMADFGIEVFDPNKPFGTALRSLPDLIREFVAATGGDATLMREVVGEESIRLVNALLAPGAESDLSQYLSIRGDGATLARDSSRVAQDALGRLERAKTELKEQAVKSTETVTTGSEGLARAAEGVGDLIEWLDKNLLPWIDESGVSQGLKRAQQLLSDPGGD